MSDYTLRPVKLVTQIPQRIYVKNVILSSPSAVTAEAQAAANAAMIYRDQANVILQEVQLEANDAVNAIQIISNETVTLFANTANSYLQEFDITANNYLDEMLQLKADCEATLANLQSFIYELNANTLVLP